jgi:hypothetical protein
MSDERQERENAANLDRIASTLERIATIGEAIVAIEMHKGAIDPAVISALTSKLKASSDALQAAIQADSSAGKGDKP